MAKKTKEKLDDFDLDADLDFGSFDFDSQNVKDDRTPTAKIKDAIKEGAKQSLSSPSTYKKMILKALPKEYGELEQDYDKLTDGVRKVYEDSVKQVKPVAADLAKNINSLVPEDMKRVKSVLAKLEAWGNDDRASLRANQEKQREDAINLQLSQIFQTQLKEEMKARAEDKAKDKINDAIGVMRHKDQMKSLGQLTLDMQRLADYQTTITQAYQKKSLELQFRSYHVQADMLELQRKHTVALMSRLDAISKNTALPDFVKIRKSETFRSVARNEFMQGAVRGIFGSASGRVEKFFSNIANDVKSVVSQAVMGASMASMGLSTANMMQDMGLGPKKSFGEMLAEGKAGDYVVHLAEKLGVKINKSLREKMPKVMQGVDLGAEWIKYAKQNGISAVSDWSKEYDWEDDETMKGKMTNFVKGVIARYMPGSQVNLSMTEDSLGSMRDTIPFTVQANKSITEVIPGLLARILREIRITRTGNESEPLVSYDWSSNKFSTSKEKIEKIKSEVNTDSTASWVASSFESKLKELGLSEQLDADQKKALAAAMMKNRYYGKSFGPEFFTNASNFRSLSKDSASSLASVFESYYGDVNDKSVQARLERIKKANQLVEWHSRVGDELGDPRAKIQDWVNAGDIDLLRQANLVDEYGRFNVDEYIKKATAKVGDKEIWSDRTIKSDVRKYSPSRALKGIRNIAVKLWKYKPGSKADDGSQDHIGPMAQDVHSQLGDEAAPDANKIDLGNLTSANIAATQGLDKKLDSLSQVLRDYVNGKQNLGSDSPQPEDKPQKKVTLQTRLATIEELLVIIAANSNQKGTYINLGDALKGGNITLSQMRRWKKFLGKYSKLEQEESRKRPDTFAGRAGDFFESMVSGAIGLGQAGITKAESLYSRAKSKVQELMPGFRSKMTKYKLKALDAAKVAKDYGQEGIDFLNGIEDMYLPGVKEPVISRLKIKAGHYLNMDTGKIVEKISDITGTIFDTAEQTTVVTKDNIQYLYTVDFISQKKIELGKRLWNKAKKFVLEGVPHVAQSLIRNIKRKALAVGEGLLKILDEPRDIYVKGETKPRLYKAGFTSGQYILKSDGSIITRPSQIKGEVIDLDGNILIRLEDISKGLVDAKDRPVVSAGQLVAGLAVGLVKHAVRSSANTINKSLAWAKKNLGKLGSWANQGWQGFKGMFEDFDFSFGIAVIGKETVSILKDIRQILDDRLPGKKASYNDSDADGDRDGSWQDIMQKKKSQTQETTKDKEDEDTNKPVDYGKEQSPIDDAKDFLLGSLKEVVTGAVSGLTSALGLGAIFGRGKTKAASAAAQAAANAAKGGKAGLLAKLGSAVKTGAGGIFKGATGILGGLGTGLTGLGTAASTAGSAITGAASAAPAAGGLLSKIASAGAKTLGGSLSGLGAMTGGAGKALAYGAQHAPGAVSTVANIAAKGGRGLLEVGRLGMQGLGKAIPVAGGLLGAYSAYQNLKEGNYGMAALDAGLAAASTFGVGATLSGIGTAAAGAATALGAVLSSPVVVGGLLAAAAGYGLYKAYKWLTKKKFTPLDLLRMYQYGLGDKDKDQHLQVYNLEKYLQPHVVQQGSSFAINSSKVDPKEIFKILDANPEDQNNTQRLTIWFDRRFKPVYLQSLKAISDIKSKVDIDQVSKLDNVKDKLKYLELVSKVSEAYSTPYLPFKTIATTTVGVDLINKIVSDLRKVYEDEIKKTDPKSAQDSSKSILGLDQAKTADDTNKAKAPESNKDDKLKNKLTQTAAQAAEENTLTNKKKEYLQNTDKLKVASTAFDTIQIGTQIKAIHALRYHCYGLQALTKPKIAALKWLEKYCFQYLKPNADGQVSLEADHFAILDKARGYFGVNPSDEKQNTAWINWFVKRFLPVYTTAAALMAKAFGSSNYPLVFENIDQYTWEAVSLSEKLMSLSQCWKVSESPWPDTELATDSDIVKGNIDYMRAKMKELEVRQEQLDAKQEKININKPKPQVQALRPQTEQRTDTYTTQTPTQPSAEPTAEAKPTAQPQYSQAPQSSSEGVNSFIGTPLKLKNVSPAAIKALLDQIAKGEGTTLEKARRFGYASDYDVTLGYGRGGLPLPPKPITQMTLREVKQYQAKLGPAWARGPGRGTVSSAVGRYQIVGTTLRQLQKELGVDDNELFSHELQDRMALQLLKRRGIDDWLAGKMSDRQFHSNLSKEWDSIADPNKQGDLTRAHSQKANTTKADIGRLFSMIRSSPEDYQQNTKPLEVKPLEPKESKDPKPKTPNFLANSSVSTTVGDEQETSFEKPSGTTTNAKPESPGSSGNTTPPMAAGPLADGAGGSTYMRINSGVNVKNLHPNFQKLIYGAAEEYGQKTGKSITVTSGYRSYEHQQQLFKKYGPGRAARPGRSLHEFGLAIDANSADLNAMEKLGILKKYGLTRPVGGEPWHVEPAGIQLDVQTAKKNAAAMGPVIDAGIGRGGGGAGATPGARKYSRDPAMHRRLLSASTAPTELPNLKQDPFGQLLTKESDSLKGQDTDRQVKESTPATPTQTKPTKAPAAPASAPVNYPATDTYTAQAFTPIRATAAPRVQPETLESQAAIVKSVDASSRILKDSLDVQRQILSVVQQLAASKQETAPAAATAVANPLPQPKVAKTLQKAPIAMTNTPLQ